MTTCDNHAFSDTVTQFRVVLYHATYTISDSFCVTSYKNQLQEQCVRLETNKKERNYQYINYQYISYQYITSDNSYKAGGVHR
jgi:hypothetical protein